MVKNEYYELKIKLNNISPQITREIIVDSSVVLQDFHKIIQTVMGWTNSHLHQFRVGNLFYSKPDEESLIESIDYTDIELQTVLNADNREIIYDYDFGDDWEHIITLKKIIYEKPKQVPICISGKRNCPPEDSGGPYGYQSLLRILKNPNHKEYKEMKQWIGKQFDSEYFDIDIINKLLKKKDYGCLCLE